VFQACGTIGGMVVQYRRHLSQKIDKKTGKLTGGCQYSNKKKYPEPRKHKDCNCPIHMDGYVSTPDGQKIPMRGSLDSRNWSHAAITLDAKVQPLLRGEKAADETTVLEAITTFLTVKRNSLPPRKGYGKKSHAVELFEARRKRSDDPLQEQEGDQEQVRKYRDVLVPLNTYCVKHGLMMLKQVTTEHLEDVLNRMKGRAIYKDGVVVGHQPKTQSGKSRYKQNLGIFFKFAVGRRFIIWNPASVLGKVTVPEIVIIPYTDDEWNRLSVAIPTTFPKIHREMTAYVLLLKNSALRMGDVTKLGPKDHPNGAVAIVMEKTNDAVWVPLPEDTLAALKTFQPKSPEHYFWTGNGDLETAKKDWSAKMLTLFNAAGIKGGTARRSHNFRRTLASKIVEHPDGSLEDAQMLLGQRKLSTTQKSYAHFGPKKKERLAALLQRVHEG
jgi:integrase